MDILYWRRKGRLSVLIEWHDSEDYVYLPKFIFSIGLFRIKTEKTFWKMNKNLSRYVVHPVKNCLEIPPVFTDQLDPTSGFAEHD